MATVLTEEKDKEEEAKTAGKRQKPGGSVSGTVEARNKRDGVKGRHK